MTKQDLILLIALLQRIKELLETNQLNQALELVDSYLVTLEQ